MGQVLQDIRFAVRSLRSAPGFTVTVMLTLALGIGLATAVSTVANAVLARPLPVTDQDRLVVLRGQTQDGSIDNFPLLHDEAREFIAGSQSLDAAEVFSSGGGVPAAFRQGEFLFHLNRTMVSGGYFDLLGTRPALGRPLHAEDDVLGAEPAVVLSHRAWLRYFGGDPEVIGRRLVQHETGVAHTIVGVMPLGLDYPLGTDLWMPAVPNTTLPDGSRYAELSVLGRLRSTASLADPRAELTAFFARPNAPAWHSEVVGAAESLETAILGNVRPAVLAFAAAAGLLLLITSINVANLLLVRGLTRIREVAVRSALGARRSRIATQLLVEGAVLAAAGGTLGAGVAALAIQGFLALAPPGTPRVDEIQVNAVVVGAAVAITSTVMILFAVIPALLTSRVDGKEALHSGSLQSGRSRRFRRGAESLVVGQIALSLLVLSAAGLIARSLLKLERIDLEFDPSNLVFAELAVPFENFGAASDQIALMELLLPSVDAVPGVQNVTPVLTTPFAGTRGITGLMAAEGQTEDEVVRNPPLSFELVTANYFSTLGIPIIRGRGISAEDRAGAPETAVITESVARYYWPEEDPIGKQLSGPGPRSWTIVGVVPDTRYHALREPGLSIYFPLAQSTFPVAPITLAIRTLGQPDGIMAGIREAVSEVEPGVGISNATTFGDFRDQQLNQPRLNALLLALFAAAAVMLSAIGLYAVMATMVRQRTRELGVRMALGATAATVGGLVVRRGTAIAAAGIVLGLIGAIALNRLLTSLLFEVRPTDLTTLLATATALLAIAVLACLIPANASTRIDPAVTLRAE